MEIPAQSPSSTSETYRLPLWWPPEMVLVPTATREDRDAVIRRAQRWIRGNA